MIKDKKFILNKLKETPSNDYFDFHYWADYIEIKCLFNPDGIFTKDDFLDAYNSNKDFNSKKSSNDYFNEDENWSSDIELTDVAFTKDKEERFADECFKMLVSRSHIFKDYYPFEINDSRRKISCKKKLVSKNRCYIFLLLSSSLKYFKQQQSIFTSSFEILSLNVLQNLLPEKAEAHFFGSSNSVLKRRKYKGHIWDKLNQLKTDLNEDIVIAKKSDFPTTDYGDSGFDFVAWIPNGDNQSHMIIFTGQAACTIKWYEKKYSSSSSALKSLIQVSVPPINLVFIPFSVRNCDGSWHRKHDIGECVLLDRQRLLFHIKENSMAYLSLPCDKVIQELLKIKESAYN